MRMTSPGAELLAATSIALATCSIYERYRRRLGSRVDGVELRTVGKPGDTEGIGVTDDHSEHRRAVVNCRQKRRHSRSVRKRGRNAASERSS